MTTLSQSDQQAEALVAAVIEADAAGDVSPLPGRLAWLLVALIVTLAAAALLLSLRFSFVTGDTRTLLSHQSMSPLGAAVYGILGALVISHRPKNPIGWILLVVGLLEVLSSFAAAYHMFGSVLWGSASFPGAAFAAWLNTWVWVPAIFLPTTFVFLLFPNGKLPSRRWQPIAWVAALSIVAIVISLALHPGPVESWGIGPNPLGFDVAPAFLEGVLNGATLLLILVVIVSVAALIGRFRRSRGVEREQMKWLVYAGMIMVLVFTVIGFIWYGFPGNPLVGELSIALTSLTILGIAAAASIAVARHNLYDIDLIINRTLVYTLLTAAIVFLYVLIVGGVGALLQTQSNWIVALVATGVVAILFQPLRQRLQQGINRLLYGQRDEPFEVLSDLGQRLQGTMTADMVYPALVETVAQTLKLPYAAISIEEKDGPSTAASYGRLAADLITYPLLYQGTMIGSLDVAPRARGESLSAADQRLLRNIARQAGTAVHAVQLTRDLQRSRRQLVTTREEERRRLRRDLHDGLGPSLAALHLQSGVLRRLIDDDPQAAQALVDEFRVDIRVTIDDLRRVVYELRPPALDELGLAAAVRSQAARWNDGMESSIQKVGGRNGREATAPPLQVTVEAPEALPPLPAAAEVAAYRIIQEALANVAHHARASHCLLRLSLNDGLGDPSLQVEIIDNGIGLNSRAQNRNGLGLVSMRERAEELGGQCTIISIPEGGTRVRALLPVG